MAEADESIEITVSRVDYRIQPVIRYEVIRTELSETAYGPGPTSCTRKIFSALAEAWVSATFGVEQDRQLFNPPDGDNLVFCSIEDVAFTPHLLHQVTDR